MIAMVTRSARVAVRQVPRVTSLPLAHNARITRVATRLSANDFSAHRSFSKDVKVQTKTNDLHVPEKDVDVDTKKKIDLHLREMELMAKAESLRRREEALEMRETGKTREEIAEDKQEVIANLCRMMNSGGP